MQGCMKSKAKRLMGVNMEGSGRALLGIWSRTGWEGDWERHRVLLEFSFGLFGRQRYRRLEVKMLKGNRPNQENTQFLPTSFTLGHWQS